jgi:hypothetical protein
VALDLIPRQECRRGHGPRSGGSVGRHLAEVQRTPPKRYDASSVVLTNDGRQGDPSRLEVGQHLPVIFEQLLLLCLRGPSVHSSAPARWSSR